LREKFTHLALCGRGQGQVFCRESRQHAKVSKIAKDYTQEYQRCPNQSSGSQMDTNRTN
jgi:hypothetical protein